MDEISASVDKGSFISFSDMPFIQAGPQESGFVVCGMEFSFVLKGPATASRPASISIGQHGLPRLPHHHPCRLKEREGDQADDRCGGDQHGVADLPAEQDAERRETNERRQPIADRDPAEQDACPENGSDRRRIGALYEALDVRVRAMPRREGAAIRTKMNDGRKMPTVETSEPQKPATR